MEAENGTHNELPEDPSHEPDNTREEEIVSDKPDDTTKIEEEKPAPLANEPGIISQTEQAEAGTSPVEEAETSAVTEEAEASTVSQSTENVADEELDTAEVTEVVQTTTDDEETAEVEQDATSLPDTQDDELAAAGSVPARQKSKYTPWMQIVAAVVLICVIGGIVFAMRQSTNGHGLGASTPLPPLTVAKWCAVNAAPAPAQDTQVNWSKVVALSANDAWVLGTLDRLNGNGSVSQFSPLLEHWNGKAWSVVQTADTSAAAKQLQEKMQQVPAPDMSSNGQMSSNVDLNDLAVLSDSNIWVVGRIAVTESAQSTDPDFPGLVSQTSSEPLIEHWDGHTWQIVASPTGTSSGGIPDGTNQLTSISAISANDIWAMGTQMIEIPVQATPPGPGVITGPVQTTPGSGSPGVFLTSMGEAGPLVEHWDGTSWTEKQLPKSMQQQNLSSGDVQALTANDVWSFEEIWNPVDFGPITATIGKQVIVSGTPVTGSAWATITNGTTGSFTLAPPSISSQILHWDGQNWNKMQLPPDPSKSLSLNGMTVIADNDIWAFGSELVNASGTPVAKPTTIPSEPGQYKSRAVIYHWDGSAWNQVANALGTDESDLASMSVIAPDNLWLLGSTGKKQPLLEHWDGKTWKVVTSQSPAYGSATQVVIKGQRAWALVDQYQKPSDQGTPSSSIAKAISQAIAYGGDYETIGTVLETNC